MGPPESIFGVDGDNGANPDGTDVEYRMRGFSWVAEDHLAAMPRPGSSKPLEQDLTFLADEGIDILVSLTEVPISPDALNEHGIAGVHIPVPDFTAPKMSQLDQWITIIDEAEANGLQVGTHCLAGRGRTGTFMAAYFVTRGFEPAEAIAEIRRLRPGSIETAAQEQAIFDYAALLKRRARTF